MSIILYIKNTLRCKLDMKILEKNEVMQIVETFVELILLGKLEDNLLQNLNIGLTIILNSSKRFDLFIEAKCSHIDE